LPVIGPASPPTRGYDAKDIVDEVLFKYVPDNQITANNGADWDWEPTTEPWCTTLNQVFKDVVNCKRKFRVRAAEGKTVKMEISVYNGAGAAGSTPSGKPVFTAKKDVVFGRCGGNNEACCPAPNKCDAPTLACNGSDTCVGCGVKDAICCPNEPKCGTGTGLTCQSGFCKVPCDTLSSAPQFLDPGLPDLHCEGGELANEYPTDPIWMTWNPVLNAKKYEITIRRSLAEQVNVACVNPIGSVDEVTITTPDDKPEYYYRVPQVFGPQAIAWKVRAINNCGDKGPESAWAHTWPNYSLW
jgi:hypothetical protein